MAELETREGRLGQRGVRGLVAQSVIGGSSTVVIFSPRAAVRWGGHRAGRATDGWVAVPGLLPAGMLCAPALTGVTEAVVGLARPPPEEATGLHATQHRRAALGAPVVEAVIDGSSPGWSFAVVVGSVCWSGWG